MNPRLAYNINMVGNFIKLAEMTDDPKLSSELQVKKAQVDFNSFDQIKLAGALSYGLRQGLGAAIPLTAGGVLGGSYLINKADEKANKLTNKALLGVGLATALGGGAALGAAAMPRKHQFSMQMPDPEKTSSENIKSSELFLIGLGDLIGFNKFEKVANRNNALLIKISACVGLDDKLDIVSRGDYSTEIKKEASEMRLLNREYCMDLTREVIKKAEEITERVKISQVLNNELLETLNIVLGING